ENAAGGSTCVARVVVAHARGAEYSGVGMEIRGQRSVGWAAAARFWCGRKREVTGGSHAKVAKVVLSFCPVVLASRLKSGIQAEIEAERWGQKNEAHERPSAFAAFATFA